MDTGTLALLAVARESYHPNLVIAQARPGASDLPLFKDRIQINNKPTAYLCENYACKQPTTDPDEIRRMLKL